MAISGNTDKISMDEYEALKAKAVSTSSKVSIEDGSLAGITPEMAANIGHGIEDYISDVKTAYNELNAILVSAADDKNMFQGEINNGIKVFGSSVRQAIYSYLDGLRAAEIEIVTEVNKAYKEHDTTLSQDLNTKTDGMTATGE